MSNTISYAYVGRAECGCIQAICMDRGDKQTSEHLAEFIAEGLTIHHVAAEYGKANFMNECEKCREPKQAEMFENASV